MPNSYSIIGMNILMPQKDSGYWQQALLKKKTNIPDNIRKLDGLVPGERLMKSGQNLSENDRKAVIDAAAMNIEQKLSFSDSLEQLLIEFNVDEQEIVKRVISRQIKNMLGK